MSKEITKAALESHLARLIQDANDIRVGKENVENQIRELNRQVDRNAGALGYNDMLIQSIKKQIEELQKPETPVTTAP
jgi:FKBP-type peptidyl-prolyl cis-trans isomerase (trigger factor)